MHLIRTPRLPSAAITARRFLSPGIQEPSPIIQSRSRIISPREPICRRCFKPVEVRGRIPSQWRPRFGLFIAAKQGQVQQKSDGRVCQLADGRVYADGATNEACNCNAPAGCATCPGYLSNITLTAASITLCSGCINVGGGFRSQAKVATFSGSFSATIALSCLWDNNGTGSTTTATAVDASPWFDFFSNAGCTTPAGAGSIYCFVVVGNTTQAQIGIYLVVPGGGASMPLFDNTNSGRVAGSHSACATTFSDSSGIPSCASQGGFSVGGYGGTVSVTMT